MRTRFLIGIGTLLIICLIAAVAVFLAKGLTISPETGTISGTGILSITSIPDQASVYLDGYLTTATNANVNSLPPKSYDVKIKKQGFIDWEKKVEVKEGLVSEIKATLFKALPSIYPLTDAGAEDIVLSPDGQQIAYVVPVKEGADALTARKSGVWVWRMSQQPISFARGAEPHQVAISQSNIDYSKALLKWSPDSSQILADFSDRKLLLDTTRLNDPARDITVVVQATLKTWEDVQKTKDQTRLQTIKDLKTRQIASESAVLKWSPDETKILYCQSDCELPPNSVKSAQLPKSNYKVIDFLSNKTYDIPVANFYSWTADSEHIVLSEGETPKSTETQATGSNIAVTKPTTQEKTLSAGKISIVEFDGFNRAEIYGGNFDPQAVIPWPDGSRLVILSSFPTATASQPNLYGINLK